MIDTQNVVRQIFMELAPERSDGLIGPGNNQEVINAIASVYAGERDAETAHDIGFHLSDWNNNAAFLVALHLFPERFTPQQVADGVEAFVIHAPNHIVAAAKLAGYPARDIFNVDALEDFPHHVDDDED
jgi:hypothetical protein